MTPVAHSTRSPLQTSRERYRVERLRSSPLDVYIYMIICIHTYRNRTLKPCVGL